MSAPEALAAELDRLVRSTQRDRRLPSVSAAVARSGQPLWSAAVGLARVAPDEPAGEDTQYRVGSITKTFTAVAVMLLRDEGALALDDRLGDHVPESAHGEPTLRRLLSHSSGLQRELPGSAWETLEFESIAALLEHLEDAEQVLPSGRHFHYSNLAYALLGEVVARRSGMPYVRFVEERLLEPLALRRTTWQAVEPASRGYLVEPYSDAVREEPDLALNADVAAGQLWSTTGDLTRWGSFLAAPDEEILAPSTAEEMRSVQVMGGTDRWLEAWGLGLELVRRGERVFAGHAGGMPGHLAGFAFLPDEGIAAAALANGPADMFGFAVTLAERAAEALPAQPGTAWRPGAEPPAELVSALGRWWSEADEWVFSWRDGRLEARRAEGPPGEELSTFAPEGSDRFRTTGGAERGEPLLLVRDGEGAVVKLVWATYPFAREARPFGS